MHNTSEMKPFPVVQWSSCFSFCCPPCEQVFVTLRIKDNWATPCCQINLWPFNSKEVQSFKACVNGDILLPVANQWGSEGQTGISVHRHSRTLSGQQELICCSCFSVRPEWKGFLKRAEGCIWSWSARTLSVTLNLAHTLVSILKMAFSPFFYRLKRKAKNECGGCKQC